MCVNRFFIVFSWGRVCDENHVMFFETHTGNWHWLNLNSITVTYGFESKILFHPVTQCQLEATKTGLTICSTLKKVRSVFVRVHKGHILYKKGTLVFIPVLDLRFKIKIVLSGCKVIFVQLEKVKRANH